MAVLQQIRVKEHVRFKLITCYTVEDHPGVLVLRSQSDIMPKTQFQEALLAIGQLVIRSKFNRIVVDKSLVKLLDHSSVEWYKAVWTELMSYNGITSHCFVAAGKTAQEAGLGGVEVVATLEEAIH